MGQKPSNQQSEVSIGTYLWPIVLSTGLAIGVGIGEAIDHVVQA
jgi:hypothetical protein